MNRISNSDQNPLLKPFVAIVEGVDMKVIENIDFLLPANSRYKLRGVSVVTRVATALTVGATCTVQDWDGVSNVETKSTSAALANSAVADTAQDLAIVASIKVIQGGHAIRFSKTVGATATVHIADIVFDLIALN